MAMSDQDAKKAFALALMERPGKPFDVAFALFPSNSETSRALQAATEWPSDPDVLEFQRNITADPQQAGILPSKYQAAREVLDRARKCRDDETYAKLMSLYCTIMGQIDKPGQPISATSNTLNIGKVIMMPAPLGVEEWSRNATSQQRNLVIEGEAMSAAK
jgi:hypothetical protein